MQLIPYLDLEKPAGERLPPQMREEIAEVAPSTLNDGQVTTPKLRDRAVESAKIGLGAVQAENIGGKQVKTGNLDDGAVGAEQIAPEAVQAEHAGTGVMTVYDAGGNPIEARTVVLTASEHAALTDPDPNTFYDVTDD
ncbi:hypothetical protein [Mycolicibacterium sp.]|uniref:hypothetical protein n=1 Tax=Mycolicibacterium sp. TaxID=2320850 RepID=UPI00356086D7